MMRQLAVVIVVLVYITSCTAYHRGAPRHACRDLLPIHGASAQTTPSPYILEAQPVEYQGNTAVNLTLKWDGVSRFRGYLIAAKDENGMLFGEFTLSNPERSGFVSCNRDYPKSTVTHSDGDDKTMAMFVWKAPDGYEGPVTMKATVVQTQKQFWADHSVRLDAIELPSTTSMVSMTTETDKDADMDPKQDGAAEPETSGFGPLLSSVLLILTCMLC